jgi:hypothetical protein
MSHNAASAISTMKLHYDHPHSESLSEARAIGIPESSLTLEHTTCHSRANHRRPRRCAASRYHVQVRVHHRDRSREATSQLRKSSSLLARHGPVASPKACLRARSPQRRSSPQGSVCQMRNALRREKLRRYVGRNFVTGGVKKHREEEEVEWALVSVNAVLAPGQD